MGTSLCCPNSSSDGGEYVFTPGRGTTMRRRPLKYRLSQQVVPREPRDKSEQVPNKAYRTVSNTSYLRLVSSIPEARLRKSTVGRQDRNQVQDLGKTSDEAKKDDVEETTATNVGCESEPTKMLTTPGDVAEIGLQGGGDNSAGGATVVMRLEEQQESRNNAEQDVQTPPLLHQQQATVQKDEDEEELRKVAEITKLRDILAAERRKQYNISIFRNYRGPYYSSKFGSFVSKGETSQKEGEDHKKSTGVGAKKHDEEEDMIRGQDVAAEANKAEMEGEDEEDAVITRGDKRRREERPILGGGLEFCSGSSRSSTPVNFGTRKYAPVQHDSHRLATIPKIKYYTNASLTKR